MQSACGATTGCEVSFLSIVEPDKAEERQQQLLTGAFFPSLTHRVTISTGREETGP